MQISWAVEKNTTMTARLAQPGDVLVFEGSDPFQGKGTQHTGIYIGRGFMINAPQSGMPVRVDDITAQQGTNTTDILRVK